MGAFGNIAPSVGLNAAIAKAGSAAGFFTGIASLSNPLTAGLGILKGVGGLFGGSKTQTNQSAAYSGGSYQSDNAFDFSYRKPFFEIDNPMHVAVAGGLLIVAIYAYKKVK